MFTIITKRPKGIRIGRWPNQTDRACIHKVTANSGYMAKLFAIKEHKNCDQSDIYCGICKEKIQRFSDMNLKD